MRLLTCAYDVTSSNADKEERRLIRLNDLLEEEILETSTREVSSTGRPTEIMDKEHYSNNNDVMLVSLATLGDLSLSFLSLALKCSLKKLTSRLGQELHFSS